jgi:hypothetical protein
MKKLDSPTYAKASVGRLPEFTRLRRAGMTHGKEPPKPPFRKGGTEWVILSQFLFMPVLS